MCLSNKLCKVYFYCFLRLFISVNDQKEEKKIPENQNKKNLILNIYVYDVGADKVWVYKKKNKKKTFGQLQESGQE